MSRWSSRLRTEINARAAKYATEHGLEHYESVGGVVLFPHDVATGRPGNFEPLAFAQIVASSAWTARLKKAHPSRTSFPPPYDKTAAEVDSCMSSDALLMSILCHPGAVSGEIARLFHVVPGAVPDFGVPGLVPRLARRPDATEIDVRIGDTHVESKLTESDFTYQAREVVERYTALDVFDAHSLPWNGDVCGSYQLIRNVLAVARQPQRRFLVLLDARRPDLVRDWWQLHAAIEAPELRTRCGLVFWQELAAAAAPLLRTFLRERYGL